MWRSEVASAMKTSKTLVSQYAKITMDNHLPWFKAENR
jgi:hypothetical protein